MSPVQSNLLLVVAKYPHTGLVKTRLGRSIGFENAAQLYLAFLRDLAPRFLPTSDDYHLRWVYIPSNSLFPELVKDILGRSIETSRMSFASYAHPGLLNQKVEQLKWALDRGFEKVVIVATDAPQLPRSYIDEAFQLLNSFDIVLGSSEDGGYYLLGTHPAYNVLNGIKMSTNHVANDIIDAAKEKSLSVALLPEIFDIDDIDDLERLVLLLEKSPDWFSPNTKEYLNSFLENADR